MIRLIIDAKIMLKIILVPLKITFWRFLRKLAIKNQLAFEDAALIWCAHCIRND